MITCKVCNAIISDNKFNDHILVNHGLKLVDYRIKYDGVKTHDCEVCMEKFTTKSQLSKHKSLCHGVKSDKEIRDEKYKNIKRDIKCEICGEMFCTRSWLSKHLSKIHNIAPKDYYIKYILQDKNDMFCKECHNITSFRFDTGFHNFCSFSCSTKWHCKNTNRVGKAMKTLQEKKNQDPSFCLNPTQLEYWRNLGYTEEEAKKMRSERQKTFTKEILIEKYGEVIGVQKWKDRQRRWQNNFKKRNYSKVSQDLFWKIKNNIQCECFFAQNDMGKLDQSGRNHEYTVDCGDSYCKLDFYIPSINYCVEFDGDYWHGENRGNKQRDIIREQKIKENNPGIIIVHVLEKDYKKYADTIIKNISSDIINRIQNADNKKI